MHTSKKIAFWALLLYTLVALLLVIANWVEHPIPDALLPSVEKIAMVVVAAYMSKAGVENYTKIKTGANTDKAG